MYPEWPASPSTSSNNPLGSFIKGFKCMLTANCVFSTTTVGSPRKYVNRMYAMCLTFNPSGADTTSVIVARCAPSGTDAKRQLFIWQFTDATVAKSGLPREYTTITGTRTDREVRCLDSAGANDAPGTNAAALNCTTDPAQRSRQQFKFLQSGSATSKQNYPGTRCGLGVPVR